MMPTGQRANNPVISVTMQVLAVDDDEVALELMTHAWNKGAIRCCARDNGREALRLAEQEQCRLVISDWDMPDMSGLELCRELRASDMCGYLYFILLTARNSTRERSKACRPGLTTSSPSRSNPAELAVRVRAGQRILALETRDVAIFALARLSESRDPDTGAHLERVQSYSRLLAQKLAGRPESSTARSTPSSSA